MLKGGLTERGCKGILLPQEAANCKNDTSCVTSTGEGSNNKIFPQKRLQCYACDSLSDKNCSEEQKDTKLRLPCVNYHIDQNCLKISYSNGRGMRKYFLIILLLKYIHCFIVVVTRGCDSDFSSSICDTAKCETCSNMDGCNFNYASKLTLKLSTVLLSILLIIITE